MRIYYAHSMHIYDTNQEARDVAMLESFGFTVVNPNSKFYKNMVTEIKAVTNPGVDPGKAIMAYFEAIVTSCKGLAFRALFDGSIPAGVWKEVQMARELSMPIIELPHLIDKRALSVDDTRAILGYNGQR